jgi:hypothetical protein
MEQQIVAAAQEVETGDRCGTDGVSPEASNGRVYHGIGMLQANSMRKYARAVSICSATLPSGGFDRYVLPVMMIDAPAARQAHLREDGR